MRDKIVDYEVIHFSKIDKQIDFEEVKLYQGLNIILGKNGSGKTTLMNCILGLEKTNITNKIFNSTNTLYITNDFLFDYEKNLEESLKFMYNCVFEKKVDIEMVLQEMNIDEEADKSILKISTGTLKKIHISPLLFLEYEYYFLDEIHTNLDKETIERLIDKTIELTRLGKTIIMSEHNQYIVDSLCEKLGDEVWIINL